MCQHSLFTWINERVLNLLWLVHSTFIVIQHLQNSTQLLVKIATKSMV